MAEKENSESLRRQIEELRAEAARLLFRIREHQT